MQDKVIVEPVSENDGETPEKPASSSEVEFGFPEYPTKSVNRQIAIVSILAAVGLFLSSRLDFGVSLKDLSAMALPYEEVYFFCTFLTYCNLISLSHSVRYEYASRSIGLELR